MMLARPTLIPAGSGESSKVRHVQETARREVDTAQHNTNIPTAMKITHERDDASATGAEPGRVGRVEKAEEPP